MSKLIAWSFSRLNDFETCPKKFNLKYIQKVFPKFDSTAKHLVHGREVHDQLEQALKTEIIVGDHLKFLLPLLTSIRRSPMYKAELQIAFDVHLNQVDWFAPNVWCRVIFDVICSPDNKCVVVIDWKTGKVKDKMRDQLALFAAAAMTMFPEAERVLTAYVWADHPHAPPTYAEYCRKDLDSLWREFGDRSELIQLSNSSGSWPAKPNYLCRWCDATAAQCDHAE